MRRIGRSLVLHLWALGAGPLKGPISLIPARRPLYPKAFQGPQGGALHGSFVVRRGRTFPSAELGIFAQEPSYNTERPRVLFLGPSYRAAVAGKAGGAWPDDAVVNAIWAGGGGPDEWLWGQ